MALFKWRKRFRGKLFGCIEVLYKLAFDTERKKIVDEYNLLPLFTELKDYVIFLESSETSSALNPSELKNFLLYYKEKGLFSDARGIILGSPQKNHIFIFMNTKQSIKIFAGRNISIAFNLPFGHSYPKMILQYDAEAEIDLEKQELIMYPCPLLDETKLLNSPYLPKAERKNLLLSPVSYGKIMKLEEMADFSSTETFE